MKKRASPIILIISAAVAVAPLHAHDVNDPFAPWIASLKRPDVGGPCCGPGDQYYATEYSEDPNGGFTVIVEGFTEPVHVPPEKINWNDVNPTGRGVLFIAQWHDYNEHAHFGPVFCFVPATGT